MPCSDSTLLANGARVMTLCNACGYCHGYCPVFDRSRQRKLFSAGDLFYLANLCHDCEACREACQYAPPHAFQVDVPNALASLRQLSYRRFGRPAHIAHLAWHSRSWLGGMLTVVLVSPLIVLFLEGSGHNPAVRSFYDILPWPMMALIGALPFVWAVASVTASLLAFWREISKSFEQPKNLRSLLLSLSDALSWRRFGLGNASCTPRGGLPHLRKYLHHAMLYGFTACILATTIASAYHHILDIQAPYALNSVPVILGIAGGCGIVIGSAGMILLSLGRRESSFKDRSFAINLLLVAASGLLLLALRQTDWLAASLALHLAAVCSFFFALPYGQFLHGPFRCAAIVLATHEEHMARIMQENRPTPQTISKDST